MKQWAGTVIGRGSNEGEARQDAQRQMWGPYGMSPSFATACLRHNERNKIISSGACRQCFMEYQLYYAPC